MSFSPGGFAAEPARAHDLEPALELLRRLDLPEKGVLEQFGRFLVVRDDGRVVGLAGLAAALVDGCLGLARKMGLRAVYLLTTTAPDYFRGRSFTDCPRDEGPAGIRESWEFRAGCPSTSAFMKRTLE
ncbi:MAG: hypothetical protein DMF79_11520 [Acidobacteria bacterium]|nr:MAG: hypothetical protein DMF79_11520 [Acidobacteriota bacterium]